MGSTYKLMKKLGLFLLLVPILVFGQGGPIIRNPFTTNANPKLTNNADVGRGFGGLVDGQVLTYDSASGTWTNKTPTGGSGGGETNAFYILGNTTNALPNSRRLIAEGVRTLLITNGSDIIITNTVDAGGTNDRQGGSLTLTNLSGNPIPFTNILVAGTLITLTTNTGVVTITCVLDTNFFQPASINLTNWSNIPTGAMANVVSATFLTNWINAVSNYVTAATNNAPVTNWTVLRQPADPELTNWADFSTNVIADTATNLIKYLTNIWGDVAKGFGSLSDGQVLKYNGTSGRWTNATDSTGGAGATNAIGQVRLNGGTIGIDLTVADFRDDGGSKFGVSSNNSIVTILVTNEVNGEISLTNNANQIFGLVKDFITGTNRLKAIAFGFGMFGTNQPTNVMAAVDNAVIASQANLTSASNKVLALQVWTNQPVGNMSITYRQAYPTNFIISSNGTIWSGNFVTNFINTPIFAPGVFPKGFVNYRDWARDSNDIANGGESFQLFLAADNDTNQSIFSYDNGGTYTPTFNMELKTNGVHKTGFEIVLSHSGPTFNLTGPEAIGVPLFQVDSAGDIQYVHGLGPYTWPDTFQAGALINSGAGILSWSPYQPPSATLTNLANNPVKNYTNAITAIYTNGVLVGNNQTNIDFVNGITGFVNGASIKLGVSVTGGAGDAGGTNSRQGGALLLTNLVNNPYTGYTNQVFGGTNINVRTVGGTNFIDSTGPVNGEISVTNNLTEMFGFVKDYSNGTNRLRSIQFLDGLFGTNQGTNIAVKFDTTATQPSISDYKLNDFRLASELGFGFTNRNANKQLRTAPTGNGYAIQALYVSNYVIIGADPQSGLGPARLLRFNADDLTSVTWFTNVNDSEHGIDQTATINDLIYIPNKHRVYQTFQSSNQTTVTEVDIDTMTATDVITDTTEKSGPRSLTSDGTFMYVLTSNNVVKYLLSDWSRISSMTTTNLTNGNYIRYDGSSLWAGGGPTTDNWLLKINTNLSRIVGSTNLSSGDGSYSVKPPVFSGEFTYVSSVKNPNQPFAYFLEVWKTNMSLARIYIDSDQGSLINHYCQSLMYDGKYIWGPVEGQPGWIIRYDPERRESLSFRQNEDLVEDDGALIVGDGARKFWMNHARPFKIERFSQQSFDPSWIWTGRSNNVELVLTNGSLAIRSNIFGHDLHARSFQAEAGNPIIYLWGTNNMGYTAFTHSNNWLPTNTFYFSVTNPSAGQVLKFSSVTYSGNGNARIMLTNDTDNTGGGGGTNTLWQTNSVNLGSAGTFNGGFAITGNVASGIANIGININTNVLQPADTDLTNWSNIPTGAMANVVAADYLTNWANAISNYANTKQQGDATLTNLAGNPIKNYTNAITAIYTNGVLVGNAGTNLDFTTGVTGFVSGSSIKLGVNIASSGGTNTLWQTNGTSIGSAGTFNGTYGLTGNINGAIVNIGVDGSLFGGGGITGMILTNLNNTDRTNWVTFDRALNFVTNALSTGVEKKDLTSGVDRAQFILFHSNKLYVAIHDAPAAVLRFNNIDDLSTYDTTNFFNVATHFSPRKLFYNNACGKLVVHFGNSTDNIVYTVNPDTLETNMVIKEIQADIDDIHMNDHYLGFSDGGTNFFEVGNCLSHNPNLNWAVWTITPSGSWTYLANWDDMTGSGFVPLPMPNFGSISATYDSELNKVIWVTASNSILYAASFSNADPITNSFTNITVRLSSIDIRTNDLRIMSQEFPIIGNYGYIPCGGDNGGAEGLSVSDKVIRVNKRTLELEMMSVGSLQSNSVSSVYSDGRYLWFGHVTNSTIKSALSGISRYNPITMEVDHSYLNISNSINWLTGDGTNRLFAVGRSLPGAVYRFRAPEINSPVVSWFQNIFTNGPGITLSNVSERYFKVSSSNTVTLSSNGVAIVTGFTNINIVNNLLVTNSSGNVSVGFPAGGGNFNTDQFSASSTHTNIKSGANFTNINAWPSNNTGPAIIAYTTVGQVTNGVEFRGTNNVPGIMLSSNNLSLINGRFDLLSAVANKTNQLDFKLNQYQAYTNALQTNQVVQITNVTEGVTLQFHALGAGRLGNGKTNAWTILFTAETGVTIYWPPGLTNGNSDILLNSNQLAVFTFIGSLGKTNVVASYRVTEGIGAN